MRGQDQPVVGWRAAGKVPPISQLNPVVEEFVGGSLIAQSCDLASSCDWIRVKDHLQGARLRLIPAENDGFPTGAFVEFRGWVHGITQGLGRWLLWQFLQYV